jgi:hypothetical protein
MNNATATMAKITRIVINMMRISFQVVRHCDFDGRTGFVLSALPQDAEGSDAYEVRRCANGESHGGP